MRDIRDLIDEFADNHPIWMWLLVRLVICICAGTVALSGVCVVTLVAVPFVLVEDYGAGLGAFAWWLVIPVCAFVALVMVGAIRWMAEEWIDD